MLVIGQIESVEKHPNADKLVVTQINIGEAIIQVVTNDMTVIPTTKVVVAMIEHKFPEFTIKQSKLRGVESFGMLCGEDVTGIIGKGVTKLPNDSIIGASFYKNGYKFKKLEEKIQVEYGFLSAYIIKGYINLESLLESTEDLSKLNAAIEILKPFIEQCENSNLIEFISFD